MFLAGYFQLQRYNVALLETIPRLDRVLSFHLLCYLLKSQYLRDVSISITQLKEAS